MGVVYTVPNIGYSTPKGGGRGLVDIHYTMCGYSVTSLYYRNHQAQRNRLQYKSCRTSPTIKTVLTLSVLTLSFLGAQMLLINNKPSVRTRSEGYSSWFCVSACLLSHISPLERLFVLKILSHTHQATTVSLKTNIGYTTPKRGGLVDIHYTTGGCIL